MITWESMFVLGLLLLIFYNIAATLRRHRFYNKEEMPEEIRNASLFLSESSIQILEPIKTHGTPDQVFLTRSVSLLVVDTKKRGFNRVYPKDILQISIYAFMLSLLYPEYSSLEYGYIRLVIGKNIQYKKVSLYSHNEVIRIYHHYWDIKKGRVRPQKTSHLPCTVCHYESPCCIK